MGRKLVGILIPTSFLVVPILTKQTRLAVDFSIVKWKDPAGILINCLFLQAPRVALGQPSHRDSPDLTIEKWYAAASQNAIALPA